MRFNSNDVSIMDGTMLSQLKKNKKCHACNIEFKIGDKFRRASTVSRMRTYHDQCFKEY